jgi:hypothetical protein
MKKTLLTVLALLIITTLGKSTRPSLSTEKAVPASPTVFTIYDDLHLGNNGLNRDVFDIALRGMTRIPGVRPVLSIVDFTQPSNQKRLYVIDLMARKLLFNTYVSHGRNSGDLVAKQFSNINSSEQSSIGFYQTMNTYHGKHGLSLKLKGLEKDFNDNAFDRSIVFHGADYVCEDFIRKTGRLGRSQGCPAVSNDLSTPIIQAIKGGSCLFLYYPDQTYLTKSPFLSGLLTT